MARPQWFEVPEETRLMLLQRIAMATRQRADVPNVAEAAVISV